MLIEKLIEIDYNFKKMPYDIQANIDILLNIVKQDPSEVENEKIKLLDITIFNCILNIDSDNPELKEIDYKYKLTQKNIENDGFNTILPDSDDIQIGYSYTNGGNVLLAPNGKPSNLKPDQYKLVRTKAFKDWFGDWEKDAENSSKVVDENGEPKIVWHGTENGGYTIFDSSKFGENTKNVDVGFFFTDTFSNARSYSDTTKENIFSETPINTNYSVFLKIKNPKKILWGKNGFKAGWDKNVDGYNGVREFVNSAFNESFDGAIVIDIDDTGRNDCYYDCGSIDYIVFEPNQIKLSNGTNTTFDGSNPDIRYKDGGEVADHKEIYQKWKSLVNMNKNELKAFYDSQEGKDAGLTLSQANELGIHNGRESARWIMKMKDTPNQNWTPEMWDWANRQISFISRMKGNKGDLYDNKGNKTRKHTSLLIWGHNPEKYNTGGDISHPSPYANFLIDEIMVRYSEKFPNDPETETTKNNLHDMWMRIEKERGSQRADATLEEVLISYFSESTKAGGYQMIRNKFEKSGWRIKSKMRELLDIYNNKPKIEKMQKYSINNDGDVINIKVIEKGDLKSLVELENGGRTIRVNSEIFDNKSDALNYLLNTEE